MQKIYKFGIFDVFGIELEYMIVDKETLNVKPIADKILIDDFGCIQNEIEFSDAAGKFNWSNELVAHVIEFKVGEPVATLNNVDKGFYRQIKRVNSLLDKYNATLMPTGMHPWMNPLIETRLWQHDSFEIYDCFNRIFSCKGHGWSNLQSTHINLPFSTDEEFYKLHNAMRFLLPIIPALSAGTPILEGGINNIADNRLMFYKDNCSKIPSITGKVVPDFTRSIEDYRNNVLKKIFEDLKEYDPDGVIRHDWVNARGIIPNFERGSLELRIIDIQECPKMDLALCELVIETLKYLLNGQASLCCSEEYVTDDLYKIFMECSKKGSRSIIANTKYLNIFGVQKEEICSLELWLRIYKTLCKQKKLFYSEEIEFILNTGCLAERIRKKINKCSMKHIYLDLVQCLKENIPFSC